MNEAKKNGDLLICCSETEKVEANDLVHMIRYIIHKNRTLE